MYLRGLGAVTIIPGVSYNSCLVMKGAYSPPPFTDLGTPAYYERGTCTVVTADAAQSAPANISVSVPTQIQTQVSPQISPNFIQQDQPQNSPVNAKTEQTASDPAMIALLRSIAERETADRQAQIANQAQAEQDNAAAAQRAEAEARQRALATGAPLDETFSYAPATSGSGGGDTTINAAGSPGVASMFAGLPGWLIPALVVGGAIMISSDKKKAGRSRTLKRK